MLLRVFSIFIVLLTCTSCDFFRLKKTLPLQELDTVIDYSSVDTSPSFENCIDLIDKSAKTICFRTTMHRHITTSLQSYPMQLVASIEETITVTLLIDIYGKVSVQHIDTSDQLKEVQQVLDFAIHESVDDIPLLFPALKRGIPVASQYQIPIQIRGNKK